MQSDGLFFLGVFGFIFIVWIATGGPTKPISFSGPYITPITNVGASQVGYGSSSWHSVNTSYSYSSGSSRSDAEAHLAELKTELAAQTAYGESSPQKGQVRLSGGTAGASDYRQEYVTVQLSSGSAPVDITGWRVVSTVTGNGASIPLGTETPSSGILSPAERIMLRPGDQAFLLTSRSPIGASFRENMCTGYYTQYQTFYPSLSRSCPSPQDEFNQYYGGNKLADDACYRYVGRLSSCTLQTSVPVNMSSACQAFVQNYLSYGGCVQAHANESHFQYSTWRVYLGGDHTMWKSSRESIKLLDSSGKTVDLITY